MFGITYFYDSPAPIPFYNTCSSFLFMMPMYDPELVKPMEEELSKLGFTALKTPAQVEKHFPGKGTILLVVNSVCGCSAGGCRPAIKLALQNSKKPKHLYTVFAGVDREATEKVRSFISHPPSSPSVALFKDGKVVFFQHRHDIQGHEPEQIAAALTRAFDMFC